jgi:hypothetical protein
VPTLVELVVPLKSFTRVVDVLGGVTKSDRSLEIQAVAPPSTSMSKESESKIARQDLLFKTATLARAIPVAIAVRASKQARSCTLRGPVSATPPQDFPFNKEILNELEDDVKDANRSWKPSHSLCA